MKTFNGKAIRNPNGKAGEYSYFATDAFFGCSNGCKYCYLTKGVYKHLWSPIPKLLKKFKNTGDAKKSFLQNIRIILENEEMSLRLKKYGMFLNFESDPFLPETIKYTTYVFMVCNYYKIPVKFLTKRADFIDKYLWGNVIWNLGTTEITDKNAAFGFTLTGHDELEPGASTNAERIAAMQKLHNAGFKTWASIEPIIDLESSLNCIYKVEPVCDLFKIGLESGKKYDRNALRQFIDDVVGRSATKPSTAKFYFKDSLLKVAGVNRAELPENCVTRDYNLFNS